MTAGSGLPRHSGGVTVVVVSFPSDSSTGGGGVLSSTGGKTGGVDARASRAALMTANSSLPVQGSTSASRSA